MMKKIILFRKDKYLEDEFLIAKKYFDVVESRALIKQNSLVIGRYSVLPFYKELENDISISNSKLINSFKEHLYIAQMEYIDDIQNYTPETFYNLTDIKNVDGPFILKGKTNSRKHQWSTKMFVNNFNEACELFHELSLDPLIGEQGVVIRKFVPLKNYGISLNGMPFSDEWRFFFFKEKLLCYNYYWSNSDNIPTKKLSIKKGN